MKTTTSKSILSLSSFVLCSLLVWVPSAHADRAGILLAAGDQLMKGDSIVYLDGELILQKDNNLVFYVNDTAYWSTNTQAKTATHAIMQPDGNAVVYNNGVSVWTSNTWNPAPGRYLFCDLETRSVGIYAPNGSLVLALTTSAPKFLNLSATAATGFEIIRSASAAVPKGRRLTGAERDTLASDLKKRYQGGASVRSLADSTRRSYGFVHRVLTESGVHLRGRGGATRRKKKA